MKKRKLKGEKVRMRKDEGHFLWNDKEKKPRFFSINGVAEDLTKPLLSYSWSSSFSFSKCHLDTTVPYDNFITQLYDADFTRYVRMFTRGYDVYTPTTNIVHLDYNNTIDVGFGKGMTYRQSSWFHEELEKKESIERVHTLLGLNSEESGSEKEANLGIYGLGKLRTLENFQDFVGIDLKKMIDNHENPKCGRLQWVPFQIDQTLRRRLDTPIGKRHSIPISPADNLYTNANDVDPEPKFPNRNVTITSLLSFYTGSIGQKHNAYGRESSIFSIMFFCFLLFLLLKMKKFVIYDLLEGYIVAVRQAKTEKRRGRNSKKLI